MILEHFGFIEQPFGVTPDPRFLYLGAQHREALASLVYGAEMNRGFLALIAPPGMGKTSLLFHFLEYLRNRTRTAFLFQTTGNAQDLLRYVLADLGLDAGGKDLPEMHEMLNRVLTEEMQAGRRFVLVIDEAQNLREDVLESVRLLSNFETPWAKLLQIVLSGQPQLAEKLARSSMTQLRQRISSFIRLRPFSLQETQAYIAHRLWVAGCEGRPVFSSSAIALIAEKSCGIPRVINNLCFQSLTIACALSQKRVDASIVHEVVSDLEVETGSGAKPVQARVPLPPAKISRASHTIDWTRVLLALGAAATIFFAVFFSGYLGNVLAFRPAASTPTGLATVNPSAPAIERSAGEPKAETSGAVLTVRITRGTSLRHLCLLYLDRFDPTTLAEVLALNPGVKDPNHVEVGQEIRLPGDHQAGAVQTQWSAQVAGRHSEVRP